MIDQNPFWGYGNGIWGTEYFKPIVLQELHWPAPHAHNAWIDFRLQLGMPGLCFAVAIWAIIRDETALRHFYSTYPGNGTSGGYIYIAEYTFIFGDDYRRSVVE